MFFGFRSVAVSVVILFAASPALSGTTHDVTVAPGGAFVFDPVDIMIAPGDTVRWTWDDDGHNVGSGLPGAPTPAFLSGPPAPTGTVFELVFDAAFLAASPVAGNLYDYHCHPHGGLGMIGSVTVSAQGIPTLPEWGAISMVSLLLVAGAIVLHRRQASPVAAR